MPTLWSLDLRLCFVYVGIKALVNIQIYTGLPEPSFLNKAINSTKLNVCLIYFSHNKLLSIKLDLKYESNKDNVNQYQ